MAAKLEDEVAHLNAKISCLQNEVQTVVQTLAFTRSQLLDVEKNYTELVRLQNVGNKVEEAMKSFSVLHNNVDTKQENLRASFDKIKSDCEAQKKQLESLIASHAILSKEVANSNERAFNKIRDCELEFANSLSKLKKELTDYVDTLKRELTVSPKDIVAQNESFVKKLEIAILDSNNSVIKVQNQEMNIRILEKKLEALANQLRKFELGKELQ